MHHRTIGVPPVNDRTPTEQTKLHRMYGSPERLPRNLQADPPQQQAPTHPGTTPTVRPLAYTDAPSYDGRPAPRRPHANGAYQTPQMYRSKKKKPQNQLFFFFFFFFLF